VPKTFDRIQISLALVVIVPVVAGCGSSLEAPASDSSASQLPASAISRGASHSGQSWMKRGASQGALLYISDYQAYTVYVYTYPGYTPVGTLTNVGTPAGECADAAANVYIADNDGKIREFAHGGTTPIMTIKLPPKSNTLACSVDPTTGNLAVTANADTDKEGEGQGEVYVYRHSRGKPERFRSSNLFNYSFLAYDNVGNLFVDGTQGYPRQFAYAELPSGSKTMTPIALTGGSIAVAGNVQWDGAHITVGDQHNAVIYQTEGSQIVGSTPLTGSSDVMGYFIDGSTVICPDFGNATVEFYNYPAGGSPVSELTGYRQPFGAVVSP
jgi:hypothetical protein